MRLALLLIVSIIFCQCRQSPVYNISEIEGNWIRINSTDYRSDSMRINITDPESTIIGLPASSTFTLGQTKWTDIVATFRDPATRRGDFTLLDLSSDGLRYESTIFFKEDTIFLVNLNHPAALGGRQTWVRN